MIHFYRGGSTVVLVDSSDPSLPMLEFTHGAWREFTCLIRIGCPPIRVPFPVRQTRTPQGLLLE